MKLLFRSVNYFHTYSPKGFFTGISNGAKDKILQGITVKFCPGCFLITEPSCYFEVKHVNHIITHI